MIKDFTLEQLVDFNESIAGDYLKEYTYPWEALPHIEEIILAIGKSLPEDRFEKRGENIWIAKSAVVFDSAYIAGPCIIDEDAESASVRSYAGRRWSERAALSAIPVS